MVGKNIQWEEDLLENKWQLHLCATVDWNGFTREYVVTFKAILLEMFGYLPKLVISSFWILKGMLLRPVSLDSNVFYDIHTCLNFCLDFEVLSWRRSYEYTCRLLACLCLSNLISISSSTWKPETLMLSSFFDDLCCDFDQQFFDCQHWAVIKKVDIFAKTTKTSERGKIINSDISVVNITTITRWSRSSKSHLWCVTHNQLHRGGRRL